MTSRGGGPVRLLAGTSADERRPPIHPGPEREWHLPAHARDPAAVHERMSAQVAAGADVLLAHTFLTHRRALARVGEARRTRELTQSAVDLAREAAEQGRDRRDPDLPWARTAVRIAGVLASLGEETGSGRLGPVDAAIARDLHDHAGLLADAGVDLIVVEGSGSAAETAAGVRAARSMGIETWAVVDHERLSTGPEVLGAPDGILVPLGDAAAADDRSRGVRERWAGPHGVMIDALSGDQAPALRQALTEGATVLGIADGATPERLAIVRAAIEAYSQDLIAEEDERSATWRDWVAEAAARAPSGSALWLAAMTPRDLPEGWDWTVVAVEELGAMPAERYRLVVSESAAADPEQIVRRLGRGGVAALAAAAKRPLPESLRILDRRVTADATWYICRREDR